MARRRRKPLRPGVDTLEDRAVPSASIIYIDANIAKDSSSTVHDGSSWKDGLASLQDGLDLASTRSGPTQLWIAQGTYTPSKVYSPLNAQGVPVVGGDVGTNTPNLETFDLPDGVSLYGGFKYGMKSLSQRRPGTYATVLSGDLDGNDTNNPTAPGYAASKADNAWHVVTLGDDITQTGVTARLDGLELIDGYADGGNDGGTLSPFVYGHSDGGGVYAAWGSNLTLNQDTFKDNFAASDGGGVFANTSNLTATNSTFLDNSSLIRAGALEGLNDFENGVSHESIVTNDDFQGNTCAVFGGAVVGEGASQGPNSMMVISGSKFYQNQAAEGGAVTIDTLTVKVSSSKFINNLATVDAGALATTNIVGTLVHVENDYATTITGSTFQGNVAEADPAAHTALDNFSGAPGLDFAQGGGALVTYANGHLNVVNDQFLYNTARNHDGGAILNGDSSGNLSGISAFAVHTTVDGSTFRGNKALSGSGGAIASESDNLSPTSTSASTVLSDVGSSFQDDTAAGSGGVFYLDDSTASLSDIKTRNNRATTANDTYSTSTAVVVTHP